LPGAPAPPAPAAPAAGPCGCLGAMFQNCKAQFCASPLGQFMGNGLAPIQAFSGGIVQPCCPTGPSAADLAAPADSPEGAAARIKADEAGAKARRANVRYLGTVDCRYWPEAKDALIGALRADRNECVRLEAALALGRGCCCNNATMAALTITVTGSDEDGKPPEVSDRVREAAEWALDNCLAHVCAEPAGIELPTEPLPIPKVEPLPIPKVGELEKRDMPKPGASPAPAVLPPVAAKAPVAPLTYYEKIEKLPRAQVVAGARRALDKVRAGHTTEVAVRSSPSSIFDIVHNAIAPPAAEQHGVNPPSVSDHSNSPVHQPPAGQSVNVVNPPAVQSNLNPPVHQQPAGIAPYATSGVVYVEPSTSRIP
jgi:hypothetical protein